jgi:putative spermidine/putrescine transport system substrate-binding protein
MGDQRAGAARSAIRRRDLLGGAAALGVGGSLLAACGKPAPKPADAIGLAASGGLFNEVLRKVWTNDFEKHSGVKVNLSPATSLAMARLQAASEHPQWDIFELTGPEFEFAVRHDLVLPLDTDIVDVKPLPSQYVKPHGVMYAIFNSCLAWDPRQIADAQRPHGWADVWDKRRPGKRSLDPVNGGAGLMEIALIADGVPTDKLYPLDVDRAFRSLDKLGQDNIIWSTSIEETVQRLVSSEVSMGSCWPFRIQKANQGGAHIGYTFEQCMLEGEYLCVVKSCRNPKAAFGLINWILHDPKACAEFSRLTHYGTPNLESLKYIPEPDLDLVPTNPKLAAKLFPANDVWWADNLERVATRFRKWQLGVAT